MDEVTTHAHVPFTPLHSGPSAALAERGRFAESLIQIIYDILKTETAATSFVIAYSGGLDSHVLLHVLSQIPNIHLTAIHINHQLNPNANLWETHCKNICTALNIPFYSEKITLTKTPQHSLEALARTARYQALSKYVDKNSILLTAHNMNDQAETFLLQAFRGSGLKGLAAMPLSKKFHDTLHLRPLLFSSRESLLQYAQRHGLQWIEDDSNLNTDFDRNYIRHQILPLILKRFPQVIATLSRSAKHASQTHYLLEKDIAEHVKSMTKQSTQLNITPLKAFSLEQQQLVLRHWFALNHIQMPTEKQLNTIIKEVIYASVDANPLFCFSHYWLRRYRHTLYLLPKNQKQTPPQAFTLGNQTIRTRQQNDNVKKLLQKKGIPPWERDSTLLIFENDHCVGIYEPC